MPDQKAVRIAQILKDQISLCWDPREVKLGSRSKLQKLYPFTSLQGTKSPTTPYQPMGIVWCSE